MDEDDCDGCEECLADLTVPSRRWRWLDMGIVFVDVAAETALAVARGFAAIRASLGAVRIPLPMRSTKRRASTCHGFSTQA